MLSETLTRHGSFICSLLRVRNAQKYVFLNPQSRPPSVLRAQLEQTANLLQDTGRESKQVVVELGYRGVGTFEFFI